MNDAVMRRVHEGAFCIATKKPIHVRTEIYELIRSSIENGYGILEFREKFTATVSPVIREDSAAAEAKSVEQTTMGVSASEPLDTSSSSPEARAERPEGDQAPAQGGWAEILERSHQWLAEWNAKERLSADDLRFGDALPEPLEDQRPTDPAGDPQTFD